MHRWIQSSWFSDVTLAALGAILLKMLPVFLMIAAGARFDFLFVANASAAALILFESGKAGNGSALAAAAVFIEIPVGGAGLVLGALASADGVVLPAVFWWACAFIDAFALAGISIIEGGWWFAVIAVALILGDSQDQGGRSVGTWIFNCDDQGVNSALQIFEAESKDCTPILTLESFTAVQGYGKAIIGRDNEVGFICAIGVEGGVEGSLISNGPASASVLVNPLGAIADEVGMVFFVVLFKDGVGAFGGGDLGIFCSRPQENRML